MSYQIDNTFTPGNGVELVFNLNSLSPLSRPSMIFDSSPRKKELIISQTTPKLLKTFTYDTLHLTALKNNDQNERIRLGIECKIKGFINNYELNKETKEEALLLEYKEKLQEVNIRSAFRIRPNNRYSIIAKVGCKNQEYYSGKHFKIFDISLTGLGLLIPNTPDRKTNPLIALEPGDTGIIGVILKEPGNEESVPEIKKLFNKIKIVRINKKFNPRYVLIGCQFKSWERNDEETLGSFIHKLQLHEIRHLQQL